MSKNDGGPTFPCSQEVWDSGYGGLPVRDWIATHVLPDMIGLALRDDINPRTVKSDIVRQAYDFADAMLKEREK